MMIRKLFTPFVFTLAIGVAAPVFAGDADLCLDCHEPAEDWEGLSADEILAKAKDASIKRHADNAELSDEQLAAIIAELMAD